MHRILPVFLAALLAGCATFDLQGHRGARGLAPENTLPAFARALAIGGVTTIELDTAVTRDGVVVVSHDPFLNPNIARGPDGRWLEKRGPNIHDLDYEALARYDCGAEDRARHPHGVSHGAAEIPGQRLHRGRRGIAAMLDLGVDGIISDRPDLVRAELSRR